MNEAKEGLAPSTRDKRPQHRENRASRHCVRPQLTPASASHGSGGANPAVVSSWDELPLVVAPSQVADLLGCSLNTLYELCRRSEVPARRIGRQWRFSRDSLRHYIETGSS
jgi:excisionase family DNA binding protein